MQNAPHNSNRPEMQFFSFRSKSDTDELCTWLSKQKFDTAHEREKPDKRDWRLINLQYGRQTVGIIAVRDRADVPHVLKCTTNARPETNEERLLKENAKLKERLSQYEEV